jgi:hypothetical protein
MSQENRRHGGGCDVVEVGPALIDAADEEVGVWFAYRSSASVVSVVHADTRVDWAKVTRSLAESFLLLWWIAKTTLPGRVPSRLARSGSC